MNSLKIPQSGLNRLANTDGRGCKNIPEAVNKLALSARLGHSCEAG